MRTELFDYDLPPELIAQIPVPRGESRLLVLDRTTGEIAHRQFPDIVNYLQPGDCLVLNDTRVTARRLQAMRESGKPAELLLLHPVGDTCWSALVRPGKSLRVGKRLPLITPEGESSLTVEVVGETPEGGRILDFGSAEMRDRVAQWGVTPLPPYITTPLPAEEEERYQTVYAAQGGSAAAPTAGLHFSETLLQRIEESGVTLVKLTLHVGVGTFRPVRTEDIDAHEMHYEVCSLSEEAARTINETQGRVIAVGTTSVRTLETAARAARQMARPEYTRVAPFAGETNLFLTPGSPFYVVEGLITNFHLPRSTLLMLVSAFATRDYVMHAYAEAIREGYRFFSFGDAMLIL